MSHTNSITIIWDEPKRQANLAKHGIDFSGISADFFADAMVLPAKLNRFIALACLEGSLTAVVFFPLGREALSIISARRASKKERMLYAKII